MQDFKFDLQRFNATFEFSYGTITFTDPGFGSVYNSGGITYQDYWYYPRQWLYSNYKTIHIGLSVKHYENGVLNPTWIDHIDVDTISGDYRILRDDDNNKSWFHDYYLENHDADYVQMYAREMGSTLQNWGGSYVSLIGGASRDVIDNWSGGNNASIYGGADKDFITNYGENVTIYGGDGNDAITNGGNYVTILGGEGDDSIYNIENSNVTASNVTINGGADNDYITNSGRYASIDGGDGDDYIINSQEFDGGRQNNIDKRNSQKADNISADILKAFVEACDSDETFHSILTEGKNSPALAGLDEATAAQVADIFRRTEEISLEALLIHDKGNAATEQDWRDYTEKVILPVLTLLNSALEAFDKSTGPTWLSGILISVLSTAISVSKANSAMKNLQDTDKATEVVTKLNLLRKNAALAKAQAATDNYMLSAIDLVNSIVSPLESVAGRVIGTGSGGIIGGEVGAWALPKLISSYLKTAYLMSEHPDMQMAPTFVNQLKNTIGLNAIENIQDLFKDYSVGTYYGDNSTLLGGADDDTIINAANTVSVHSGDNDDVIANSGYYVTIDGGAGADTIYNFGHVGSVNGGKDDDTIYNLGYFSTVAGGAGNDVIENYNEEVSILGGNDNDTITTFAAMTTIAGNRGNDLIYLSDYDCNVVEYSLGDGNDIIWGFTETDTLKILSGTYTLNKLADGILVKVGSGSITLKNIGTSNITIEGLPSFAKGVSFNGAICYISPEFDGEVIDFNGVDLPVKTIDASDASHGIKIVGNEQINSFKGSGYSDIIRTTPTANVSSSNFIGSSFVGEENVGEEKISAVTINGGGGDDTIYGGERENFYVYNSGDGNDVIYNVGARDTLSISGGSYSQTISGDDLIIKVGNGSVTFKNSANQTLNIIGKEIFEPAWNLVSTTATYGDLITVTGVKSLDGIAFDGKKTVTLSADALNEKTVTITKGYTLKIDKSVPTSSKTVAATWTKDGDEFTYTAAGTPAYYKLASNKLTFTAAKGYEQFTLTGIKSTNGVKVSGKKVTVGKKSLGDSDVTFSTEDGFTLALDSSVTAAKEIKAGWKKFTYTAAGTTAGYKLNGDKIVYSEQDGGETFTISGVKDIKNIFVDGKTVTVGKNSLNGKTVELTGDTFELALAGDVPTEATKESGAFKSCAKGTAIFKTSSYSNDFYTLGDDKIFYTAAGGNEIKISGLNPSATLADVPSAIKISDDGGSLKISFNSADVLDGKAPTISAPKGVSYTVAVDEKLSVAEQKSDWTTKGTNATLAADTSATYNVSKNKITCTPKKSGKPEVVLAGLVKDAKLATPKDKLITLDASNLGTKSSLKSNAGDYSIELTGDMSGKIFVGSTSADTIQIAADNALVDGGKGNDQFDISGTTTVKELAQIDDGVQLTFSNKATLTVTDVDDTFEVVGKKQTFTVDTSKFAVAKNLTFDETSVTVAADFTGSIEQADDIYTGGKLSTVTTFDASAAGNISIEGNAKANKIYGGAGDDTLIYGSGDGKDVIFGFADDDLLEITGNFTTSVNKTGTEIAFKVGSTANAITLKEFTATEFHIGDDTYHISDGKLVK